ncbi:MAG: hydroxymethylbilane synthase [Dehalococcoidia bacterium]
MWPPKPLAIGTRGSGLAWRQAEEVAEALRRLHPHQEFRLCDIKTLGDTAEEAPLLGLGRGIFVKEIEGLLLRGEIDLAVHSLKDLPTRLPPGLVIGAVLQRGDPRDVLVNRWELPLAELPSGARLGTSSPRRVAQVKALRPDIQVSPIRGNVDTRLRKGTGPDYDGVVLAAAGLARLGLEDQVAEYFDPQEFVPAPGQGALAVELRAGEDKLLQVVAGLNHRPTRLAVTAERAFVEALGGGCQTPAAAYARVDGDALILTALIAAEDGSRVYRTKGRGSVSNPHGVALDVHQRLIEKGAGELVARSG